MRRLKSKLQTGNAPSGKTKLMSLDFRIVHILAIFSLGALTLTGISEHGFSLLPFHVYFGTACGVVLAVYSFIVFARRRVRLFDSIKRPLNSQVKEGFAVVSKYLFGASLPSDVKAQMGRYNILASYASLVLALSFIPLTIGGVAMVFLQRGTFVYEEMKALHLLGVGLIALFFLVHFFAVINSENRPLLKAMFGYGQVSERILSTQDALYGSRLVVPDLFRCIHWEATRELCPRAFFPSGENPLSCSKILIKNMTCVALFLIANHQPRSR
jgi:hypothetical protein